MKTIICMALCIAFTFNTAAQNRKRTDTDRAMKKYTRSLKELDKTNDTATAEYYFKRGGLRQDFNDLEGAINDYTKAIALEPSAKSYYNRGLAKMDLKQLNEAIADFTKAIETDPKTHFAYNNRGICKYALHDHVGAIQDYSMAILINPTNAEAYNNRAISKIKLGLLEEGCADLRKAYELGDYKAMDNIKRLCK